MMDERGLENIERGLAEDEKDVESMDERLRVISVEMRLLQESLARKRPGIEERQLLVIEKRSSLDEKWRKLAEIRNSLIF